MLKIQYFFVDVVFLYNLLILNKIKNEYLEVFPILVFYVLEMQALVQEDNVN